MKLSKRTLEVLKNFQSINPSLSVKPGNRVATISISGKVYASAVIAESFDRPFAVYELSKLLGVLSLFKEPELTLGESSMTISEEGRSTEFVYTNPETVVSPPDKNLELNSAEASFTMTWSMFQEITKAAAILTVPVIRFVGDGSRIRVVAVDPKNKSSHTFSVDVGAASSTFEMDFKTEVFRFLQGDYKVDLSTRMARFQSEDVTYFVATEVKK